MQKKIWLIIGLSIIMLSTACTEQAGIINEPVKDMVTGRWATLDHQTVVLVDLPKKKFQMLQVTEFGLYPVLVAKNLKIENESKKPEQVTISFDFQKKRTSLRLDIEYNNDGTYYIILVNTLTGKDTPLDYVSDEVNFKQ